LESFVAGKAEIWGQIPRKDQWCLKTNQLTWTELLRLIHRAGIYQVDCGYIWMKWLCWTLWLKWTTCLSPHLTDCGDGLSGHYIQLQWAGTVYAITTYFEDVLWSKQDIKQVVFMGIESHVSRVSFHQPWFAVVNVVLGCDAVWSHRLVDW
jgi:hypothetical protein